MESDDDTRLENGGINEEESLINLLLAPILSNISLKVTLKMTISLNEL